MKPTLDDEDLAVTDDSAPPPWAVRNCKPLFNLSEIRREMGALYWCWRKHGKLTVGQLHMAGQHLRNIAGIMEMERDTRITELERKIAQLEALQGSPPTPCPAEPNSTGKNLN